MRRHIGVRELRRQLSASVNAAIAGERIIITMRGKPVASLGPVESQAREASLDQLAAVGLVEPPRRSDRPEPPHPHVLPADAQLSRVLGQIRGR